MKKVIVLLGLFCAACNLSAQTKLNQEIALKLSRMPLHCIPSEFPNKTSHLSDSVADARLLPSELHPVFYGCLDWHSSVHGHWMLVRLLQEYPQLPNRDSIIAVLDNSFQRDKMEREASYFGKYTASNTYERTYGWAWLLKLDEALASGKDPVFQKWHQSMQPLTQKIISLWKAYLPKQTYPNRTGVHPNTAFGLAFAYDWAKQQGDTAFLHQISTKAKEFYFGNSDMPAYLEPDGSDFFSPSLMAADLMKRVLDKKAFNTWFEQYYKTRSIDRLCAMPVVSDRSDYQTVHLDGLSFSRAWCMRSISSQLSDRNPYKVRFKTASDAFLNATLPQIFNGGYGGEHWLASFAIYALLETP
ncbi:DUF2891 domain-containing protein [Edaphocola flava]|uniref:DUF2891 domain-containing protein n=1 Tax=Edaphocola flava TaxID=2499629 RepID=UPI00100AF0AB|nr:DUF2891 domain-containing protein [Edaphocola flava]